jgi:hypothetical protein
VFASVTEVKATLDRFAAAFDAAACSGAEAVELVTELSAVRRLVEGLLARALARVDATAAHSHGNDRDAAALGARLLGVPVGEARSMLQTGARLRELPALDAAVRSGTVSARQAGMIADAARANPGAETELVAVAAQGMVPLQDACVRARAEAEDPEARAARQRAARCMRMWTAADGMLEGRFRLQPEMGGQLKAELEDLTRRIFRARRRSGEHEPLEAYAADALVEAVCASRAGDADPKSRRRGGAQVHVVIDHGALVRGAAVPGESCEIPGVGPVSVAWARDLLGDAFLTAVIKKGRDITTVAHLGRHVPAELRTALIVAGRECDVEGCHLRGYLELDHSEIDHAKGGPTAFWNLKWKCWIHHRRKSAGERLGPPDPATGKRSFRARASRRRDADPGGAARASPDAA